MSWLLLTLGLAVAEEPAAAIIVEAHRDIEVYVAPIEVIVATHVENIEAEVDTNSAFAYSSMYSHSAKIENERGAYEPVELNNDRIKVYNEDTIVYAWEDCNYKIKPLKCSIENNHYYLETTIHVDDNEVVVRALLFDSEAQVIAQGVSTNKKIVRWIKQQEIQQQQTLYNQNVQAPQRNCGTSSCTTSKGATTSPMSTVTTSKPKEEMPLKWTIPHRLLNRHVQQAMLLMWCSTRLDIY